MGIAIVLGIIGIAALVGVGVAAYHGRFVLLGLCASIGIICGMGALVGVASDQYTVNNSEALSNSRYKITINGDTIYCADYVEGWSAELDGKYCPHQDIYIPSHWYKRLGFINSWEYCNEPMLIAIPEGEKLPIKDIQALQAPKVYKGSVECK